MTPLWFTLITLWASSLAIGVVVAVRAGARANPIGKSALALFLGAWLFACVLGFAVVGERGSAIAAVAAASPLQRSHGTAGRFVVAAVWVAFFFLLPMSVERGVRTRRWGVVVLQIVLSVLMVLAVLATGFTGYLGGPPATERTLQRFRVLHTIVLPIIATLLVGAWFVNGRRLWGKSEGRPTT